MSFFQNFPVIPYDSEGNGELKDVTNILRRVVVRTKVEDNTAVFDTYDVKEGETPEMIAHKLYGDINLHWVILLFNKVKDRYHDWPMTQQQFDLYMKDKYGIENISAVHHYEITQESGHGNIKIDVGTSNTLYPSATAITNYDFEEKLQNERRRIKLLDPRYVDQFVAEFKEKISETVI
tara:strand:+ start:5706 stop:6242 length:537 start_codon:yes stop_codon:yes gene_type:complete